MARQGTIVETFRGIFRPFRCQKIPIAPNQHPTLAARLEKSGSTAPSPLPVRRFHIHSKTACRGASACRWHASYEPTGAGAETKSFCPCHKTGENTGFSPVFFLHVLHGYVVHLGSDTGFSPPDFIRPQPSSSPPAPETHPVSPFSGFSRVRFALFVLF